eukprot:g3253.t1
MAAPVPKKPKGKSLSWKLPEDLAKSSLTESSHISKQRTPRRVTLRMSSLLDRLEVNAGDVSVSGTEVASIQENVGLSPRSMRSLSPNGTLLERRVIDLDRTRHSRGCDLYGG